MFFYTAEAECKGPSDWIMVFIEIEKMNNALEMYYELLKIKKMRSMRYEKGKSTEDAERNDETIEDAESSHTETKEIEVI